MMNGDTIAFLQRVEIFSLLSPDEIQRIIGLFAERSLAAGDLLFREGDEGNELFIVKTGSVVSTIRLPDGGEREIAEFRQGDFFGEMSIFENAPRSATCTCRESCILLGLHEKDFFRMMDEFPDIATKIMYRMLNITTQRLRDTGEFLSDMVQWGEAARRRAITDELTGAYNRRFLDDALTGQFELARTGGKPLSLVMIDMDFFREINALYGDETGDQCIIETVRAINRNIRGYDIICRFGGDEFVIIMPDTDAATAIDISEKVRAEVERLDVLKKRTGAIKRITLSLGVASYPEHAENLNTLKEAADQALYRAKEAGRNRVGIASPLSKNRGV